MIGFLLDLPLARTFIRPSGERGNTNEIAYSRYELWPLRCDHRKGGEGDRPFGNFEIRLGFQYGRD